MHNNGLQVTIYTIPVSFIVPRLISSSVPILGLYFAVPVAMPRSFRLELYNNIETKGEKQT